MDRREEACNVIKAVNKYRCGRLPDYELIKYVCNYFDVMKNETLTQADLKFLKYISNVVGIPHYFDILGEKFQHNIEIDEFDLNTLSACMAESALHLTETNKLHKFQKKIYDLFDANNQNRYFLTASTSFGKTHLIYDIIRKMNYSNIVLMFPTIALLSENLERLVSNNEYQYFKDNFKIHTLSEADELGDRNIFIYTPERFLSYTDKNSIELDFVFIDEAYKLNNDYLIDETTIENERDVAYRLATFQALESTRDILLAGPYIETPRNNEYLNNSFNLFLERNQIKKVDYNSYELVNKIHQSIGGKRTNLELGEGVLIDINGVRKGSKLIEIINALNNIQENGIIYCSGPGRVETYTQNIIDSGILTGYNTTSYDNFLKHICKAYSKDWIVYRALKYGIGIHHGLIPKYIQKEIINLFNNNDNALRFLISTTTITEGVNTTAKNLIVLHDKKGDKPLKSFDAKNISGRAGRFLQHYSGRVIVLMNKFEKILYAEDDYMKHKNYDKNVQKDEIDLFYTDDEFLNNKNRQAKSKIKEEQQKRALPEELFNRYKTVSRKDKIIVYDNVEKLSDEQKDKIATCLYKIKYSTPKIDWDGFQVILDAIFPIVNKKTFLYVLINKRGKSQHSLIVYLLNGYLENGFKGLVDDSMRFRNKNIDQAMQDAARLIYNTFKYQLVKYIGVFNDIYKFVMADKNITKMDDIDGIDRLLIKLEYNAFTPIGRKVSDYGVPTNILNYFEAMEQQNLGEANSIKSKFDDYEKRILLNAERILD